MKFATLAAALALVACSRETPSDELLIFGGPIYTGVEARPTVEAVAVKHGRIDYAGTLADAKRRVTRSAAQIDLEGAALYPGFVDAHAHLLGVGLRELTLNLEGVSSIEELLGVVAAEAAKRKAGDVVYGRGWIETGWPEGRFPTRDDLDPVSPNNPVLLVRADGHALVANSAALAATGIDAGTPDPTGGRIEKDASGRPTGMLIDEAMSLVSSLIESPTPSRKEEAYRAGARVYAAYGWTGLHNMSVDPGGFAPDDGGSGGFGDVDLIERLAESGEIPIRVYNAVDPEGLDKLIGEAPRTSARGRVVTRAVKFYIDGALGSRGALLAEPYADQPGTSGLLRLEHGQAIEAFTKALRAGVQVSTHAIGDRGNRLVLDWYEEALDAVPRSERVVPDPRWRIEHAQILDTDDIPRFARLGVVASVQPSHAISDMHFAPARLGPERLDGAYAWKSLLHSGALVAGGSDAPVERGDPLIEFYAAVARRDLKGFQGPDWRPQEAVSRLEALKMFTLAPAIASFQEQSLGTIEAGKEADFTAFSEDIMTVPEAEILSAKPVLTVVKGEVVYRADGL